MSTITKKGTCPVCGHMCFSIAHIEDGRVIKVEPDRESPLGHLCIRGVNAVEYHHHPQRLNYPMKRTGRR